MNLKLITPATTEALTLTEAKAHLRITSSTEDTLITSLIKAARQYCENFTNRALASATYELILDEFPEKIKLPMPPVTSITSIKYMDSDNLEVTMAPADYIFYDSEPAVIIPAYSTSWPSYEEFPIGAVKVRYVAGYTTNIPDAIKQAMLLVIGALNENRENIIIGQTVIKLPMGAESLLYPYRIFTF